jgi:hypothetical protein
MRTQKTRSDKGIEDNRNTKAQKNTQEGPEIKICGFHSAYP